MKTNSLMIASASLLALFGCSDSGNGATALSGTAFDGNIKNGIVCVDVNANNKCDVGEPTTKTDVFGKFTIGDTNGATGNLLITGGTDMGTGLPFKGILKAPANSTVISPITSAIQALVDAGTTVDVAESTIKKALNIPTTVELTSYDPFDELQKAGASTNSKNDAKSVLAAQSQLQILVHSISATVAGADTTGKTTIEDTMTLAFNSVAKGLKTAVSNADATGATVIISEKLVSDATKEVANTKYENNVKARVAVKAIADDSAISAVASANVTKDAVSKANVETDNVTLLSDTGILRANTTLQSEVETKSKDASIKVASLNANDLKVIADAQDAQEVAEADKAKKVILKREADKKVIEAKALASSTNATQVQIVAAQTAILKAAEAAEAQAKAEQDVAEKSDLAAQEEAQVDATVALKKQEAASVAKAKAKAELDLAIAEKIVATKAESRAKSATDIESAKAAITAVEEEEKANLNLAKTVLEEQKAVFKAAVEKLQSAAKAEAETKIAEAKAKAEKAEIEKKTDEENSKRPTTTGAAS